MAERSIRLGVAGLGRAFSLMLPTFASDPRITLVAATDLREEARNRFEREFGGQSFESVEALCADPKVEAIYVATPHQMHTRHILAAASRGKHVLVEKPMAISLDECQAIIAGVRNAGIQIVVGHSHSFNAPILRTRQLIESGEFGAVRMIHAMNYTDYMVRPRRPEELDTSQGGGVLFSQASHQIDIVRLLGGGKVRTVRANAGNWDASRPTEGAYSALLTFEDNAFASCTYSGYAHFDSDEFLGWVGELGVPKDPTRHGIRRKALEVARNAQQEAEMKAAQNYGGIDFLPARQPPPHHQHFGSVIVSCDRADLRPVSDGVMIYRDHDIRHDRLPPPTIPRREVVDEFHAAVVDGIAPLHDATWSRATLEVCLAILDSSRTKAEIPLRYQVGRQS